MKYFTFYKSLESQLFEPNARLVFIPSKIANKKELFFLFSKQLDFPEYFGNNWDALYDCLKDLDWLKQNRVIIIHEDIPFNNQEKEKRIYIELLYEAAESWEGYLEHSLEIVFPRYYKQEIENVLVEKLK